LWSAAQTTHRTKAGNRAPLEGLNRMSVNRLRNLILIPWLSLPIMLASYVLLWNRMPSEIAVHFASSGKPDTLMSREQSLLFDLITLLIVLSICSWKLWGRGRHPERALVGYYFAIVAMTIIFLGILLFNLAA
jgi:uncharacterized membrane protein